MRRVTKLLIGLLALLVVAVVGGLGAAVLLHIQGTAAVEEAWREYDPPEIADLGTTRSLGILPLVTWRTADSHLKGEAGLSYLVRTDSTTILLDLGLNAEEVEPSPLLHNMNALGISLDQIDAVFITHNHVDHVGGARWTRAGSFSLGNEQADLTGKEVFVPVPLTYPGVEPRHTADPTVLGPGVATTGTIPRRLFIGAVDEQALVVHVAGRGLVLIVGCGHQTVPKLVERTEAVFSQPIYGIVGGLHYPVPEGRMKLLGIDVQRRFASGNTKYVDVLAGIVLGHRWTGDWLRGFAGLDYRSEKGKKLEGFRLVPSGLVA